MKNALTILIMSCTVFLFVACSESPSTHTGETQMSDNLSVTLTENLSDKNVSAAVELLSKPDGTAKTKLMIGTTEIGYFASDKLNFTPDQYGDIACKIVYLNAEGGEIETRDDTLNIRIETWFLSVQTDVGYTVTIMENGDNKLMYTSPRAIGNNDLTWMYEIRIPYEKTMKFTASIESGDLTVHFRGDDYADRNDLYIAPDEALKHIDPETDKYIASPYELSHGVYRIYVAPSATCALSLLKVVHHSEGISGEVTGYVKTLKF